MVATVWVIGIAAIAALCGALAGSRFGGRARNIKALQDELEAARQETATTRSELAAARKDHEDYRQTVMQQFEQTAVKFKQATNSYVELHNQLATSASVLCGEVAAGSLLEGTSFKALTDRRVEPSVSTVETLAVEEPAEIGAEADQAEEPPILVNEVVSEVGNEVAPEPAEPTGADQTAPADQTQPPLSSSGGSSR